MQEGQMTWQERAEKVFAQRCNTYSKRAESYVKGAMPTHYEDFHGVDYVCGLGSNLIGIQNNFSLPSTQEVVLAERLQAIFPFMEKMKFVKTGSAACSAAVRIARACTGKRRVVGCGYHGSDNWTIAAESPGTGTVSEGYEKYASFADLPLEDNVAAVIIEPVQLDLNVKPYLKEIRQQCTERGIVLIFDEVITGFRFLDYSVSNNFGITPDLICMGKALGNGYPIGIVGGRNEIMETPGYFISNTHNGELSAINASLETLDFLTDRKIEELWDRGKWFQDEFNQLSPSLKIIGYPTRGEFQGDPLIHALFMQEACKRGYLFGRAWFITYSHTEEVLNRTLLACQDVFQEINNGAKLEGEMPKPLFKRN